ncbi:MAG TPA: hypothetical protein VFP59_14295 [Candidatus Angelobacter sp.]|nr:hypothetical protein [Candidatus Angelobacter sp.]
MAVVIPSFFFEDSSADKSSPEKRPPHALPKAADSLSQDEVNAILDFFLILDKWDQQKKAA